MIQLVEPVWGVEILLALHEWMSLGHSWSSFLHFMADAVVLSYPVVLLALYIVGIARNDRVYKQGAVWMFWVAILSAVINVVFQTLFFKDRPDLVLDLGFSKREDLILYDYLPEASFPSDHAAMAMGIALATIRYGYVQARKLQAIVASRIFTVIGWLFLIFGLVMMFARVAIGIHWVTDVLGGLVVGSVVFVLMSGKAIYPRIMRYLVQPVLSLQEWIWKVFR